jgi:hypothetical protein
MVIFWAFAALLAGFVTMAALVGTLTALLGWLLPEWTGAEGKLLPGYIFVNIAYSFLAAVAGGYMTAIVARGNPLVLVLALALIVLLLAALSALQSRGRQPVWYQLTLVAITPLGVLGGGILRLKVLGIL